MKLPMKAHAYPSVGSFTSHPAESPAIKELHSRRSHEDHEAVLRIPATASYSSWLRGSILTCDQASDDYPSRVNNKSPAVTTLPAFTDTSATVAARGLYTAVSIFIASIESSRSPSLTA